MTINNTPEYARNYRYIVYREVNGENWFYGAYSDHAKAFDVAIEVEGYIYEQEV